LRFGWSVLVEIDEVKLQNCDNSLNFSEFYVTRIVDCIFV
jgi:hypothetical protein